GVDPAHRDRRHLGATGGERLAEDVEAAEASGPEDQTGAEHPAGDLELLAHAAPPWLARTTSMRWPSWSRQVAQSLRGTTSSSRAMATPRRSSMPAAARTTSSAGAPLPGTSIEAPFTVSSMPGPQERTGRGGRRQWPREPRPRTPPMQWHR